MLFSFFVLLFFQLFHYLFLLLDVHSIFFIFFKFRKIINFIKSIFIIWDRPYDFYIEWSEIKISKYDSNAMLFFFWVFNLFFFFPLLIAGNEINKFSSLLLKKINVNGNFYICFLFLLLIVIFIFIWIWINKETKILHFSFNICKILHNLLISCLEIFFNWLIFF